MSADPLVSLICPILNVEKYVAQTIEGILCQSYKHWELLFIDGVSKDKTKEIIQGYSSVDSRIRIYSQPDEGPLDAAEKGLAIAKGEYIAFLGGQDFFHDKSWLSTAVDIFNKDKAVSLVWSLGMGITEEGKEVPTNSSYIHLIEGRDKLKALAVLAKKIINTFKDLFFASWERKKFLLRKVFSKSAPLRINSIASLGFADGKLPQKEGWFFYWLKTGLVFPDQSLVVNKKVFVECYSRYEAGSKRVNSFTDFVFNFHTKGYMSYFVPTYSVYGRLHANNSGDRAAKDIYLEGEKYFDNIQHFKDRNTGKKFCFRDREGKIVFCRSIF